MLYNEKAGGVLNPSPANHVVLKLLVLGSRTLLILQTQACNAMELESTSRERLRRLSLV